MDPSFLMDWKVLLKENNESNSGHPYRIPSAFITFLAKLRAMYSIPSSDLKGIARIFARINGITTVCYTSIFRRKRKIVSAISDSNGIPVDCAVDSTGYKITIRGDYLGSKWKKPWKGWSKIHAVISINDVSMLSFAKTDDHVHDAGKDRKILENIREKVKKIFADRGYDSKAIFNEFGSSTVIPPRNNASSRSKGSPSRSKIVRQI